MSSSASLAYRRHILGTNKCKVGQCPKTLYFKTVNGNMFSGNNQIKGSELTANRQYSALVKKANVKPSNWTTNTLYVNNINKFGSAIGAPHPSIRMPPKNIFNK